MMRESPEEIHRPKEFHHFPRILPFFGSSVGCEKIKEIEDGLVGLPRKVTGCVTLVAIDLLPCASLGV